MLYGIAVIIILNFELLGGFGTKYRNIVSIYLKSADATSEISAFSNWPVEISYIYTRGASLQPPTHSPDSAPPTAADPAPDGLEIFLRTYFYYFEEMRYKFQLNIG